IFGPCVTNPLTRHPAVAASAIGTINELSGGRAFWGIATGDSAVLNLGLRPAKLAEMREYILAVRGMLEEGSAEYRGRPNRLNWHKARVPIHIAAEGPRTLRLAGEVADGVVIGTGFIPEVIADTLAFIDEGARKSGRRVEDLDLWWLVDAHVDADGERAREDIRTSLAASAHHSFAFTLEGKRIPKELESGIRALRDGYKTSEHNVIEKGHNASLVDEYGLRDYLAERFAIVGSPDECRKRLEDMENMGVIGLRINNALPDRTVFMDTWAREVRGVA
ncbi:MAG: LLM class flavin-dependent oxidoreductase, partial [Nitrospinae bacterium]|nr:LLM class flavin-dependent oxidoreductase [Nitrospinota bacterium]